MSRGRPLKRAVAIARAPQTKEAMRRASIERLLAAALALFVTRGYQATSTEEVAARAGLTKGAVYFYFKSKATVLDRLLDPTNTSVTLHTLERAAHALDRRLSVRLT